MGFFSTESTTRWTVTEAVPEVAEIKYNTFPATEVISSIALSSGSLPTGATSTISIPNGTFTVNSSGVSSDIAGVFTFVVRVISSLGSFFKTYTIEVFKELVITIPSKTFTYTGSPIPLPYTVYPNSPVRVTYALVGGTPATVPPTLPGIYDVNVEAIYGFGYVGSAQSLLIIEKPIGRIEFSDISDKNYESPNFTLVATSTSGSPVLFFSENPAAVSISGKEATILDAGASFVYIRAVESNPYWNTPSKSKRVNFARAPQTITAVTPQNITTRTIPFNISASSTSKLALSYSITQGPATITSEGLITILGAGIIRVAISQPGNSNYEPTSTSIQFVSYQYTQVFQEGVTAYLTTANQRSSCPSPVAQDYLLCEPQPGVWPSIQSNLAGVWERVELWWEYVKKTDNW